MPSSFECRYCSFYFELVSKSVDGIINYCPNCGEKYEPDEDEYDEDYRGDEEDDNLWLE